MVRLLRNRENRREPRRPTFVKARICYGPSDSVTLPCTMLNISNGGAMLETADVSLMPLAFRLLDVNQDLAYDCKVIWRRGSHVGVQFGRLIDLQSKSDPAARDLNAVRKSLAGK